LGVTIEEPEDLIRVPVAAAAARRFAEMVLGFDSATSARLTADAISDTLNTTAHIWDATVAAYEAAFPDEHVEKVGFAREVVHVLRHVDEDGMDPELGRAREATLSNFALMLGRLADLLHDARAKEDDAQQRDRVSRLVRGFLHDHPNGVIRDLARILFREIDKALEDTDEGDARRMRLAEMRRKYELATEPTQQVPNYEEFKSELNALRYQERLAHQDRRRDIDAPRTESVDRDSVPIDEAEETFAGPRKRVDTASKS
jgi:hypothetical protein